MHARSAVVDLYGDHLPAHGWWAPVAGVVRLAQTCGVTPAATRTAVSRLVREGWLAARTIDRARGYAATPLAQHRLRRAHVRIYAPGPPAWDGRWHVVVVEHHGDRRRRDHVAASLGYLGYGHLATATWVSPWVSPELGAVLEGHGAAWTAWTGDPHGSRSPAELARRLWDLPALAASYEEFARTLPAPEPGLSTLPPHAAYPLRTRLVHEWRKFLFRDPGLPAEVLPPGWPGQRVRQRLLEVADALAPSAGAFVEGTLRSARPGGGPAA
ncbi:PaaX family transcriptional regulator [Ornithinimicrobium sp. W1679]|uniref:PaaX family transcriptional regulator n=1 Tax=Ornithinimicrobium sp. W1679 TaxID=3418770 RepID=UPI003CECA0C3